MHVWFNNPLNEASDICNIFQPEMNSRYKVLGSRHKIKHKLLMVNVSTYGDKSL